MIDSPISAARVIGLGLFIFIPVTKNPLISMWPRHVICRHQGGQGRICEHLSTQKFRYNQKTLFPGMILTRSSHVTMVGMLIKSGYRERGVGGTDIWRFVRRSREYFQAAGASPDMITRHD
jgi:hypothetical protein